MGGEPGLRTVLGVLASAAIPATFLLGLAGEPRRTWGLSAAPFGPPVLLAAQIVAALPLGLVLADALRLAAPRIGTLAWALIGLILLGTTGAIGPATAAVLDEAGAGFFARAVLRSAL